MCSRLVEWQTYVDDAHLFEHLVPCPMIPYKSLLAAELERFHLRHDLIQSQECLSSIPPLFPTRQWIRGWSNDRQTLMMFTFLVVPYPKIPYKSNLAADLEIPSEQSVIPSQECCPIFSFPFPVTRQRVHGWSNDRQTDVDAAIPCEHLVTGPRIHYKSRLGDSIRTTCRDTIARMSLPRSLLSFHLDNEFVVGRMTDWRWWHPGGGNDR